MRRGLLLLLTLAWLAMPLPPGAAAGEPVTVIVRLKEQAALTAESGMERTAVQRHLVEALREKASRAQAPLLDWLAGEQAAGRVWQVTPYWIFNGMAVTLDASRIPALAGRPEVASISADITFTAPVTQSAAPGIEFNLVQAGAVQLWLLGYRGQGVVVATLDTGVDPAHPDLAAKYRGGGNSWYDPYGQHAAPVDLAGASTGHGTEVMGVILGETTGMAPGAKWIAARIYNDSGFGSLAKIHLAYQWLLDPDGNPLTPDAPQVVNNSWAFGSAGCVIDANLQSDFAALRAAGILPVFSAGNYGPNPSSDPSPANYTTAFAVGAIDPADAILAFSSRGPSPCRPSEQPFPDLAAPGQSVRTTTIGGSYAYRTGTSLAAPHAAGALALLLSVQPGLTAAAQERALRQGAFDLGAPGADNTYGSGRLSAFTAYRWLTDWAPLPLNQVVLPYLAR